MSEAETIEGAPLSPFEALRNYAPLAPSIAALAFGRAGLIVASYGSYNSTDEGIFTDGAMLITLGILLVLLIVLAVTKAQLSKTLVNRIMRACVLLEAASLVGLAAVDALDPANAPVRLALCALCTLTASGAIYYWLRRARGSATITATIYVLSALILSEAEIYLISFMPVVLGCSLAAALVCAQLPLMKMARTRTLACSIPSLTFTSDYFGFAKSMLSSKQFLMATAIGIGCLSVVIGLLRGYPDGQPIAFSPVTHTCYTLLTIGICLAIVSMVMQHRQRIMTEGVFVLMEALACAALVAYAAFPNALDIGAVFTTTLNAVMVAFTWYVIIAFMSHGWRDPYYYAIAGWLVWLGCRAVARVLLLEASSVSVNAMLACTIMGTMVVVSTQVVFVQFVNIARRESEPGETAEDATKESVLVKIMGLDEHERPPESQADVRQASMKRNAAEMGRQFLLSEREMEVLALYALGFTQKRVAEELFISPGTAHAHIKRIYAKTGLHSRQEILDYMRNYTS